MRKKLIATFVATALAITGAFSFSFESDVYAAQIAEGVGNVNPIYVNDITNVPKEGTGDYTTISWLPAELTKMYSFSLAKTSYVRIDAMSDMGKQVLMNKEGYVNMRVDYNGTPVNCDNVTSSALSTYSVAHRYLILEPGNYNIYMNREDDDTANTQSGTTKLRIYAKEIVRSYPTGGDLLSNAVSIPERTVVKGTLSATTRNQWYMFSVKKESKINIEFMQENDFEGNIKARSAGVTLYSADGNTVMATVQTFGIYGQTYSNSVIVPAGTYYFRITGDYKTSSNTLRELNPGAYAVTNLSYTIGNADNIPPKVPEVDSKRAGTTKITGTGEENARVFVEVNGKKYEGTVASNGHFEIYVGEYLKVGDAVKVYLQDEAGNKSDLKEFKVAGHLIARPKLTTCRKGLRYVKGSCSKKKATITVKVGNVYRFAKSSNFGIFKVKLKTRLKKGQKIKVMVTDKYGNKSKWRTVKVK